MTNEVDSRDISKRRLVTIMFTDMVGYSALCSKDEKLALEILKQHQRIFESTFTKFNGVKIKSTGDGYLIEFSSTIDAVLCAIEIQSQIQQQNATLSSSNRVLHRIGIHVGEIYHNNGDWHGDSVNIASRLEGISDDGGICISQLVAELVAYEPTIVTKSKGLKKLKNIEKPMIVHQVSLPWEKSKGDYQSKNNNLSFFKSFDFRSALQAIGNELPLLSLIFVLGMSLGAFIKNISKNIPNFEEVVKKDKIIDLRDGWEYSVDFHKKDPGKSTWKPFIYQSRNKLVETLHGHYWLRKKFNDYKEYLHPAFSIGFVKGRYKVFLNGEFIGGSNEIAPLKFQAFPRDILKSEGGNEFLIEIKGRKSFYPGYTQFSHIFPMINELDRIDGIFSRNRMGYYDIRAFYVSAAFIMALLCFGIFLFDRNKRITFYYGMYLVAGAISIFTSHPVAINYMAEKSYYFVPLATIFFSSFVLFSSYLFSRKKYRFEVINNYFVFFAASGMVLYYYRDVTLFVEVAERLSIIKNLFYGYSLTWGSYLIYDLVKMSRKKFEGKFHNNKVFIYSLYSGLVAIVFNGLGALFISSISLYSPKNTGLATELDRFINRIGSTFPLLFSLVVVLTGAMVQYYLSRKALHGQKTKEFLLEVSSILWSSAGINEKILKFQKILCFYFKADRSSIFLRDIHSGNYSLVSTHANYEVKSVILKNTNSGSFGKVVEYVLNTKEPLLIRDITKDHRFVEYISKRPVNSYASNSAMLFPLIVEGEVFGVISIADKLNGKSFKASEFAIMKLVVRELSMLISHSQKNQEEEKENIFQLHSA